MAAGGRLSLEVVAQLLAISYIIYGYVWGSFACPRSKLHVHIMLLLTERTFVPEAQELQTTAYSLAVYVHR